MPERNGHNIKKYLIILTNVIIVLGILAFVVLYAQGENRSIVETQTDAFESMTVAMEHVTTNYLEGEQRICDSWANYINAHDLTIEEAVDFLRDARAVPEAMGHIIYIDDQSMDGLSTDPQADSADNCSVS